jgi:peptidoglycan/xylan/chitin deacetylase (PgdA/CDA1 family)
MYHDVVDPGRADASGFPGRDANSYKVTAGQFRAHLDAILTKVSPGGPPVFTFDDGGAGASAAADILEAYGQRGHFFVTTNYIGTSGFLSAGAVHDLDLRGHVIGSHSCSHPLRIGRCSSGQLRDEWRRSHAALSAILGRAITAASIPGGDFQPAVAEAAAEAGFTNLFTSEPTTTTRGASGLTLHGRFTIRSWTAARTAAALAAGDYLPRTQQALAWNLRKIGKRLGGERYLQIRRLLFGAGRQVQWGDCRDNRTTR